MIKIDLDRSELNQLIEELGELPEIVEAAIRDTATDIARIVARKVKSETNIAQRKVLLKPTVIAASLRPEEILTDSIKVRQNRRRRYHNVRSYNRRTKNGSTRVRAHRRKGRIAYTLPKILQSSENYGFWIGYPNNLRGRNRKLEPVAVDLRPAFPDKNTLIPLEQYKELLEENILKRINR